MVVIWNDSRTFTEFLIEMWFSDPPYLIISLDFWMSIVAELRNVFAKDP